MTFTAVRYTKFFLGVMAQCNSKETGYKIIPYHNKPTKTKGKNILSKSSRAQNMKTFSREPTKHQMDGQ